MFAILMTEKTMPQILELECLTAQDRRALPRYYVNRPVDHYFIRGYTNLRGVVFDWNILPAHVFERTFEYDPIKIQTDWDLIVRKV